MRFLFNLFFGLIIAFMCCLPCRAEIVDKTEINSIKEYEEYFNDYAKRLYDNFHPEKKLFFFEQGNFFYFFIKRDGSIEHLDTFFEDDRFSKYCRKLILNTPAYPFPDEIKDDKIFVSMYMGYFKDNLYYVTLEGRCKLYASFYWKRFYDKPSINVVEMYIERDCLKESKD